MPSVSSAQSGLMQLASTANGRKRLQADGKKAPPPEVAKEYAAADKGRSKKLPMRAKKK